MAVTQRGPTDRVLDAVVVGGGLAGLAAGYAMRHRDVLVLETTSRTGGRFYSEPRGQYWLNFGGHVVSNPNSAMGRLIDQLGLRTAPIPGSLTAVAMDGTLVKRGRVETYPARLPLSSRGRQALVRAGVRIRLAVHQYSKLLRALEDVDFYRAQERLLSFLGDQTFSEWVGPLPDDARALLRCTVTRASGDFDQQTAGFGVGIFNLVWDRALGQARNVAGGSSMVPQAITSRLGPQIVPDAEVLEVESRADDVVIKSRHAHQVHTVRARYAVLATPAYVTRRILTNLPVDLARALDQIRYGKTVVTAFLTNEATPRWWDDVYAIATPGRSMSMIFNQASVCRGAELERAPGGSLMAYTMGHPAGPLLENDDEWIVSTYLEDLDRMFPGFSSTIEEARVQRWPAAMPYPYPGRATVERALVRPHGRIFLAGDYLGLPNSDTAVASGTRAAERILSKLAWPECTPAN